MKKLIAISILVVTTVLVQSFNSFKEKEHIQLTPYSFNLPGYILRGFISMNLPEDNPLTVEGVALGKQLFFDRRFSKDNTIACGSCHIQAFAFSDTGTFSKGVDGISGDRNSMSLVNMAWSSRFFWDGRAENLREQIHEPIIDKREMASTWADVLTAIKKDDDYVRQFRLIFGSENITDEMVKKAIEQFVLTITSFNSRYDQYWYSDKRDALNEEEIKGLNIFRNHCTNCHSHGLLTDNLFHNNGLDSLPNPGLYNATADKKDLGKMKTPTLRNVALTAPYMHDGRFKTLEEVVDFYNSNIQTSSPNIDFHIQPFGKGMNFNDKEKEHLIAFLHSLTDSTLTKNKEYAE